MDDSAENGTHKLTFTKGGKPVITVAGELAALETFATEVVNGMPDYDTAIIQKRSKVARMITKQAAVSQQAASDKGKNAGRQAA